LMIPRGRGEPQAVRRPDSGDVVADLVMTKLIKRSFAGFLVMAGMELALTGCVTKRPLIATGEPLPPTPRLGSSCEWRLFGRIGLWGDTDTYSAARAAGISVISVVDTVTTNYFVASKVCTLAYGT